MIKTRLGELKFRTAYLWIKCLQKNKSPVDNLRKREIDSIIIYGITELGELLVNEAIEKKFNIIAITDKKVVQKNIFYNIPVIPVNDLFINEYQNDYVIVTSMNCVEEIEEELNIMGIKNIIPLIDLL